MAVTIKIIGSHREAVGKDTYMSKVKFNISCIASYLSELNIPDDIANDKMAVLEYIRAHLNDCNVSELVWINDLEPDEAVTLEDIKYIETEESIISEEEMLKRAVIDSGVNAIEEFIGHSLDSDDIDIESEINDCISQMPEDEYQNYIDKYLNKK